MQLDVKTGDNLLGEDSRPVLSDTTASVIAKIIAFNNLVSILPIRMRTNESVPIAISTALANNLDKKLQSIGADIEYLAETKYGAPTDKQLLEVTNEAGQNLHEKIDSLRASGKSQVAEADKVRQKLEIYATVESHPIEADRWEVWYDNQPEIFAHWFSRMEKLWALKKLIDDLWAELKEARRKLYEKRSEAIIRTLNDVGVRFADPDSLKFSPLSDDIAIASLKKAVKFYPQLWVDASNVKQQLSGPLLVVTASGRAQYNPKYKHEQSWSFPVTDVIIVTKPKEWKPDPHDLNESRYMDLNGADTWRDPLTRGIIHYNEDENKEEGTSWGLISYEYYEGEGIPSASGWEKVELYKNQNPETLRTGIVKTYYRKPMVNLVESHKGSRLLISQDDDFGVGAAIHEFGHRVDHSIMTLMILEQCFLNRRGSNYPVADGETPPVREMPSIIAGRKDEYGYKGGFPRHYMGRIYSDNDPQNEILSTGMEALFTGNYGGLAGAGIDITPDVGFKRFILGMLAACANDNT